MLGDRSFRERRRPVWPSCVLIFVHYRGRQYLVSAFFFAVRATNLDGNKCRDRLGFLLFTPKCSLSFRGDLLVRASDLHA